MTKENTLRVLKELAKLYPDARAELNFSNPFETLIATILSAQCTDKRVNIVTERLFRMYPNSHVMADVPLETLENDIRECGLYRMKAKHIIETCKALNERFGGEVPNTREMLMALPGVGQKTAGVVLMAAFGSDEIPVDTHVHRVSNRIGLACASTAEETEKQLLKAIPVGERAFTHHLLIWHGRRCCSAKKPECGRCPLSDGLCENKP